MNTLDDFYNQFNAKVPKSQKSIWQTKLKNLVKCTYYVLRIDIVYNIFSLAEMPEQTFTTLFEVFLL